MKYTLTFTREHEEELKRIASTDSFAGKIARTILSGEEYKASPKQVVILNKEAEEVTFSISHHYDVFFNGEHEREIRRQIRLHCEL